MPTLTKHTDLVRRADVDALLAVPDGPQVSIYLPTHRVWSEVPQDPVRLRNLVRIAESRLQDGGLRKPEIQTLLAPAADLVRDEAFWRFQSDGLALFLAPGFFASYRVPHALEEQVAVGPRFVLRPLLPALVPEHRFYVLTLNQQGAHLFRGTATLLDEQPLASPTSLDEALQFDEVEPYLALRSGRSPGGPGPETGGVYYGQGGAADEANVKKGILLFFQQLAANVERHLARETAPLVLVGVSFLQGLYRTVSHYPELLESGVDTDPTTLSREGLHARTWALVAPRFDEPRGEALAQYAQFNRTMPTRVARDLETAVPAACYQRVSTLFIPDRETYWGTFDPDSGRIQVHDEKQPGDVDLLDVAAIYTLRHNGTVYVMAPDDMPERTPVAALLRF